MSKVRGRNVVPLVTTILGVGTIILIPFQIPVTTFSVMNARFFPYVVAIAIVLFSISNVFTEFYRATNGSAENEQVEQQSRGYARVTLAFLTLVVWLLLISYVGFIPITILMTAVTMLVMGNRSWLQIALTSLLLPIALYLLFNYALQVVLP